MAQQLNREEKLKLIGGLMWDYNIDASECLDVLEGKKDRAYHYDAAGLFKKLIESYRWFTILKLLAPERISELLTDQTIKRLRFKSLWDQYNFIREELHRFSNYSRVT